MRVIAVVGQKGGTGKTTLVENLFVEALAAGIEALIVDLDPQATAAQWADRRSEDGAAAVSTQAPRLERVLKEAKAKGVQLCILDTPAQAPAASLEAARVADLVLTPVRPVVNDMETLHAVSDLLTIAGLPRSLVVLNYAPLQGNRSESAKEVAEKLGLEVCPVVLHNRTAFHDAPAPGQGVREFDPKGRAAIEMASLAQVAFKLLNFRTSKHANTKERAA